MAEPGKMEINFDKLLGNYRDFRHLPAYIKSYIDALNAPILKRNEEHRQKGEKEEGLNTPCCLQVSDALNLTETDPAKKIAPKSPSKAMGFRPNPQLPPGSGRYCVQNVLELEEHLTAAYGKGEEVKTGPTMTQPQVEAALKDRQGILLFRDGGLGFHTELWNKTSIVQNGAPSADGSPRGLMSPQIFGKKRVVFWEAIGDLASRVGVVPDWLEGWWEVKDGASTFYYYFFRFGTVYFTQTRPRKFLFCPVTNAGNSGTYRIDPSRKLTITWNTGPQAREFYTPMEARNPPSFAGSLPGEAARPFTATKISK
jgi:hypothetical protein